MKKKNLMSFTFAAVLSVSAILTGCTNPKDLYDPYDGEYPSKPSGEYFDFKTTTTVVLRVNYGLPGYKAFFSVYGEEPFAEDGFTFKKDITPLFCAFTNQDNTFTGAITLPKAQTKVYLCSFYPGIPSCIELDVNGDIISYSNEKPTSRTTRSSADSRASIGGNLQTIDQTNKLYALYNGIDDANLPLNTNESSIYASVNPQENISSNSANQTTIGELLGRIQNTVGKKAAGEEIDNSEFIITDAAKTNITVSKDTRINLVFLSANSRTHNALGYYYYPSGAKLSAAYISSLPKYMVFPKLQTGTKNGYSAQLQFFGENYDQQGTDNFPAGYDIGWALIATDIDYNETEINTINAAINKNAGNAIYSNYYDNSKQARPGFITLYDETAGKFVIGIENTAFEPAKNGNNSYEDILFYVEANMADAIVNQQNLQVPAIIKEKEVEMTDEIYGVLAFEDIWPGNSDYDMNDVVMSYTSTITFNQNNEIKRIVDTFTPVHDGASYQNAFGYVVNGPVGKVNMAESQFFDKEMDNQFIVFYNVKTRQRETAVIVREFNDNFPDKSIYMRDYNPFIVPHYDKGTTNRVEVHLPKYVPTALANHKLIGTGNDAFYVHKTGKHPFAIDLAFIRNYKVPKEGTVIGKAYPLFDEWVMEGTNQDWYLYPEKRNVQ